MQRLLITVVSLFFSGIVLAIPSYQIDLILFAQPEANQNAPVMDMPLLPINPKALELKPSIGKQIQLYSLLSPSYSDLKDQYYLLSRKSSYPVLGHYSWRQPANSDKLVALPLQERNGWQMQGTFRISQGAYYNFDAHLQVSTPSHPQSAFTVSQKQRLKGDRVYYLDNDYLGMVIKIHPEA